MSGRVSHALIAEDDDDDFAIFSNAVDKVAVAIVLSRAENGEILMKKLDEFETLPDILFFDLLMPYSDGKDCLKRIRADKRFDALPIIIFSRIKDKSVIEYCFREGSNFYILKPGSIKELVNSLEKIFSIDWKNLYYPPLSQFLLPNETS